MADQKSAEEIKSRIVGPINSMPTPFCLDEQIDWDGFRNTIEKGIEGGTNVTLLTAGNSMLMYLSHDEIEELTRTTVDQV